MPDNVTQDQVERMQAAIDKDTGGPAAALASAPKAEAPAKAPAPAPGTIDDLGLGDPPTEEELAQVEAEDAAAGTGDDGWKSIRQRYTPEQIADLERQVDGSRAMARTSHQRNQEAARMLAQAEESRLKSEQAYQQTLLMHSGLSQLANRLPPDQFQEVMRALGQDGQRGIQGDLSTMGIQAPPMRESAEVAGLKRELAELKQNVHGFAYGVNSSATTSEIYAQLSQVPLMRVVERAGDLDSVAKRVMDRILQEDRDNPGSINPLDGRSLRAAVKQFVEAEVKIEKRKRDVYVRDWIDERKRQNAKAPPSARGPGGGARLVTREGGAKLPAGLSESEKIEAWTQRLIAAGRRPSTGIASEIG